MQSLLGLAILVWMLVVFADAMKGPLSNPRKALWIILILFLPVIGALLYLLLVKKITIGEISRRLKPAYLRLKGLLKGRAFKRQN